MSIEPISIVILILGMLTIWRGPDIGILFLTLSVFLGAAAAVKLTALGNATIQPAHALLPFYIASVAKTPDGIQRMLKALSYPSPGFWAALFAGYVLIAGVFLPRIFADQITVFSLSRGLGDQPGLIILMPLSPGSGNITQSVYQAGNLMAFAAVYAHVTAGGFRALSRALLVMVGFHIACGVADMATHALGRTDLLNVIRNASYGIQVEGSVAGIRRVIGSFTEPAVFGAASVTLLAFTAELFLRGIRPVLTGLLSVALVCAVFLSMSSSSFGAIAVYGAVRYVALVAACLRGQANVQFAIAVLAVPFALACFALALAIDTQLAHWLDEIARHTLFDKVTSQSALERGSWNVYGIKAFMDSSMIGAGTGSIRTSSFPVALLANVGVVGFVLFLAFLAGIVVRARKAPENRLHRAVVAASGWAMFVNLLPAMVIGTTIDLGILFFVFAGLICAMGARVAGAEPGSVLPARPMMAMEPRHS